jgi:hypothetical protein
MTLAKTIAVLSVSLVFVACSSEGGEDGPNFPGSTENEYSLLFNGVDGFGSAGNISTSLDSSVEAFSLSIWFKSAGVPAADSVMLQLNPELETGSDSMQVSVYWASSDEVGVHLTPDFANVPGARIVAAVPDPQGWNHVMLTFDAQAASGNAKMYLNGALVGSGDQGVSLTAVGNIQFAKTGIGTDFYHGSLDEVAIWDTVLSGEDIAGVYNDGKPKNVRFDFPGYTSSGTVRSLWRMGDENFLLEENVSDLVGENHFTIVGGGVFQLDTP